MLRLLTAVIIITVFIVGCHTESRTDAQSTDTFASSEAYFGWFTGKKEFSFKTVTQTVGEISGMKVESLVTANYVVSNGKEAVQEIEVLTTNGTVAPEKVKIYITSAETNYIINPLTKQFYTEPGNLKAENFSKVWMWTRKATESYESLISSGCQKDTLSINGENLENFTVNGVNFVYDSEKRLRQYKGIASGMVTTIDFSDYLTAGVDIGVFDIINKLESEGYQKVETISEL